MKPQRTWDPIDIAWIAGILEGEGHFGIWEKRSKGYAYPVYRIACNMCDLDVLERLHRLVGIGHLSGPQKRQQPHHLPAWRWSLNKRADIYDLAVALLPHMGKRRGERLRQMIATLETTDRGSWQHGTRWGYEKGCRCEACRAAHATRMRTRREMNRDEINAKQRERYRKRKMAAHQ